MIYNCYLASVWYDIDMKRYTYNIDYVHLGKILPENYHMAIVENTTTYANISQPCNYDGTNAAVTTY
jgi:hypothetical protein